MFERGTGVYLGVGGNLSSCHIAYFMDETKEQEAILNIWYDLPEEILEKVPLVYQSVNGWLGFGKYGFGQDGIPYWFGFDNDIKTISASVEPGGLQVSGKMRDVEWTIWLNEFKDIASRILGFKVGEIENGEVGYEIEYIK